MRIFDRQFSIRLHSTSALQPRTQTAVSQHGHDTVRRRAPGAWKLTSELGTPAMRRDGAPHSIGGSPPYPVAALGQPGSNDQRALTLGWMSRGAHVSGHDFGKKLRWASQRS